LKKLFASDAFGGPRKAADFREDSKRFFVNYFKQISMVFGAAWTGPEVQHQVGDRAARLHPGGARRRSAPRSGPR
jgi:hypothetical protein